MGRKYISCRVYARSSDDSFMSNDMNIDDSFYEWEDLFDDVFLEEGIDDGGLFQYDEVEEVDKKMIDDFGSDVEIDVDVVENVDENDFFGGFQIEMIDEIFVLDCFVDQVIGQEYVCDVIMKVVKQCCYVMMIGFLGMGKLMFVKVMFEFFFCEELQDVFVYYNFDDGNCFKVCMVFVGKGD